MKAIYILILIILSSLLSFSQSTFLKSNQFVSDRFYNKDIFEVNDEYWVIGDEDAGASTYKFYLAKYNEFGDLISRVYLSKNNSYCFYLESELIDSNKLYVISAELNLYNELIYNNLIYDSDGNFLYSLNYDSCYTSIKYYNPNLLIGIFKRFSIDSVTNKLYSTEVETRVLNRDLTVQVSIAKEYNQIIVEDTIYAFRQTQNESIEYGIFRYETNGSMIDSIHLGTIPFFNVYTFTNYFLIWGRKFNIINPGYIACLYKIDFSGNILDSLILDKGSANSISLAKLNNNRIYLVYNWLANTSDFWKSDVYSLNSNLDTVFEIRYSTSNKHFTFIPIYQIQSNGMLGMSTHWNQPYQYNIMKTDSLGQVFESDYMGGITFTISNSYVNEHDPNTEISLFPNPTTSHFTIQSSSNIKSLTVYNLQGQQVLQKSNLNETNYTVEEQLPNGVYVVKVETEEGVEVRKVLVQ